MYYNIYDMALYIIWYNIRYMSIVIIVRVQRLAHVCTTFLHINKLDTSLRGSDQANY